MRCSTLPGAHVRSVAHRLRVPTERSRYPVDAFQRAKVVAPPRLDHHLALEPSPTEITMGDVGAPWPPLECTLSLASCRLRAESLARRLHSKLWAPGGSSFEGSLHAAAARRRSCSSGEITTASMAKPNPYLLRGYGASGGLVNGHWGGQRRMDGEKFQALDESDEEEIVSSPPGRRSIVGEMGGVLTAVLRGKVTEAEEEFFSDASSEGFEEGRLYRGCSYEAGLDKLGLGNDDDGLPNGEEDSDEEQEVEGARKMTNVGEKVQWTNGECIDDDDDDDDEGVEEEEDEEELDRVLEKAIKFGLSNGSVLEAGKLPSTNGFGTEGNCEDHQEENMSLECAHEEVRDDRSVEKVTCESDEGETEEETEDEEEDEIEGRISVIENSKLRPAWDGVAVVTDVVKDSDLNSDVRTVQLKSPYEGECKDEVIEVNEPLDEKTVSTDTSCEVPDSCENEEVVPAINNDAVLRPAEDESEEEETDEEISDEDGVTEEETDEEEGEYDVAGKMEENKGPQETETSGESETESDADSDSEAEQIVQTFDEQAIIKKEFIKFRETDSDDDDNSEADKSNRLSFEDEEAATDANKNVRENLAESVSTDFPDAKGEHKEPESKKVAGTFVKFRSSSDDEEECDVKKTDDLNIGDRMEVKREVVNSNQNYIKFRVADSDEEEEDDVLGENAEHTEYDKVEEMSGMVNYGFRDSDGALNDNCSVSRDREGDDFELSDEDTGVEDVKNCQESTSAKSEESDSEEEEEEDTTSDQGDVVLNKNFVKFRLDCCDYEEEDDKTLELKKTDAGDKKEYIRFRIPGSDDNVAGDECEENVISKDGFVRFRMDSCDEDDDTKPVAEIESVDKVVSKPSVQFRSDSCDILAVENCVRFQHDEDDKKGAQDIAVIDKSVAGTEFIKFRSDSCDAENDQIETPHDDFEVHDDDEDKDNDEDDEVDELEDEDKVLNQVIGRLKLSSDDEENDDEIAIDQSDTTQTLKVNRFKFQVTPVSEEAHLEGLMNDSEWLQARCGLRQGSSLTDDDSDEGEMSVSRRFLLRSTSLKSGKTPPGTPRRKKIVRFADALGLDLEAVRHIVSDDIPTVPASAFFDLRLEVGQPSPSIATPACLARRCLYPQFSQPFTESGFLDRVRTEKVCLENVVVTFLGLYGVVRVLNCCFHKSVIVRYTTDDWVTKENTTASYVQGTSDGFSDRFRFTLHVPDLRTGDRLVLAVRFRAEDGDYWDNNGGRNYVLRCLELTSLSGEPDITPDDGHISFV